MTTIPFKPMAIHPPKDVRPTLTEVQTSINKLRMSQVDSKCTYDDDAGIIVPQPPYDQDLPVPKGIVHVANYDLNFLATSQDLIDLQNSSNARDALRKHDASWKGLTINMALDDAREALFGIPTDLFKNSEPVSVRDLFTKNNRLRGIGVLMTITSVLFMLIQM